MGRLGRMFGLAAAVLCATATFVTVQSFWLDRRAAQPAPAAVIIVLGGGVESDGYPGPDTLERVRHGIDLFQAGLAPRIHFTGGHDNPDVIGMGESMADVARAAGVPDDAISTESQSRSTLQNALFSLTVVPPDDARPAILVSDGYHLGRAWASFRWAGYGPAEISAATAFGAGHPVDKIRRVARETLAIWFNAARALVWSGLDALGIDRSGNADFLAHHPAVTRLPA